MKDERVKEIAADAETQIADAELSIGGGLQYAIRQALAERDREVAEWAEENGVECLIRQGEDTETMVDVSALLAFLEAQP